MNDSCVHGDKCSNLHSWCYGDRISSLAKLQGHNKVLITLFPIQGNAVLQIVYSYVNIFGWMELLT
jgi:hypothetical protein